MYIYNISASECQPPDHDHGLLSVSWPKIRGRQNQCPDHAMDRDRESEVATRIQDPSPRNRRGRKIDFPSTDENPSRRRVFRETEAGL